ncbi:MAG: DUF4097 family beta strand repeat-containing protein [Oscillospiraceae bacterium]|nr:DUF4097 family beta strand repeat-containing protein [Oscillospiraceae bacterium]
MDKNAYLKELSRHLPRRMPAREREDTLRWYEEYFQEAGPEREAEVIEELGSPETVARRVAEEGGWTQEKGRSRRMVVGTAVAAVLLIAALCAGIWGTLLRTAPDDSAASPGVSTGQQDPGGMYGVPPQTGSPVPATDPGPSQNPGASPEPGPGQSQSPGGDPVQALDAFTEIETQVAVGDVTIRRGTEFQIEVAFEGTVQGEPYRIEYGVTDGTLNVVSFPRHHNDSDGDCSGQVLVTVPEDTTLEEIKISLGLGDVTLRELSVDEAKLETGMGDLSVIDTAAREVELSTGMGDVEISGIPAAEMELSTGMGNVTARLDCTPEECSWMLTSGMGSIQVDGVTSLMSASHKAPGGSRRLNGSTGMGDVSVTFS